MKKSTKLALNRETLRVLGNLDLARVDGGTAERKVLGTEGPITGCPFVAAAQPDKP